MPNFTFSRVVTRFNKNPLHPSPSYYRELNINRCYQQVISSRRKIRPRFSSSHGLSLCVCPVTISILIVSPSQPSIFDFFPRLHFHEVLSELMFIPLMLPHYSHARIQFISITMDELVRVSERKGEKVYLYSACEYLTNYRREIARSY